MATANELLAVARKELGNTESPAGSNRTKYGKWYGMNGVPWCMIFVQWCFAQAGIVLPLWTASCGELMRAAKAAGCWVTRDFQPGDVVIYDFPGGAATDHCGIVEVELPDYGVQAIEGNTSPDRATATSSGRARSNSAQALDALVAESYGSQSNGGMVCRKNRPAKYIVGAVRPRFETEEDEDMDLTRITDKQAYELLEKAQRYAAALPAPDWAAGELREAMDRGITDGSRPMGLAMRYETAIMTKRAAG